MKVTKARDLSPTAGSFTIVAGPPGLGKSTFAGTVAEYVGADRTLLIATLPREVNSTEYQKHNIDTIVCADDQWEPSAGKAGLIATGYDCLIDTLRQLRTDDQYSAVILDNGTEAAEMAWHASMAPLGVADPNDLGRGGNRFAPYTTLREKMEQLMRSLSILTGKTGLVTRPKLVIVPWHVQPPKETSDNDDSADEKGQGAEYEGSYLPMVRGGFRRRLGGLVDNYVYAAIENVRSGNSMTGTPHYCIQVVTDNDRHVKIAGQVPTDGLIKSKYLDVHQNPKAWGEFMSIIEAAQEAS